VSDFLLSYHCPFVCLYCRTSHAAPRQCHSTARQTAAQHHTPAHTFSCESTNLPLRKIWRLPRRVVGGGKLMGCCQTVRSIINSTAACGQRYIGKSRLLQAFHLSYGPCKFRSPKCVRHTARKMTDLVCPFPAVDSHCPAVVCRAHFGALFGFC